MAKKADIRHLKLQACEMRKNLLKLSHEAGLLHIGGDLSLTDIMTVLYQYGLKYDVNNPKWDGRDRFVLSKGHGSGALFIAQAMVGFYDIETIYKTYMRLDSNFGMHPCSNMIASVDVSTGSLGHGLSVSVGLALAARLDKKSHRIFTVMGDGELQEGSIWEGAMAAGQYKLGNIIGFVDRNSLSFDGPTEEFMKLEPLEDKWRAFGWNAFTIDGNNIEQLVNVIDNLPPSQSDIPTVIICKTVKGKGVSFMENSSGWHAGTINSETLKNCCDIIDKEIEKLRS
jgi:transketolase